MDRIRLGPEYGDAVRVASFGSVEPGFDPVDHVVHDLEMVGVALDENADRHEVAHRGPEVPEGDAFNPQVAAAADRKEGRRSAGIEGRARFRR